MKISAANVITATGMLAASLLPLPALAHLGHLGELAGHGHLIAVGLGAVATIGLAGLAVLGKKDRQEADDAVDASDATAEEGAGSHA